MKHLFFVVCFMVCALTPIYAQRDTTHFLIKHVNYSEIDESNFEFKPSIQPYLAQLFDRAEVLNLRLGQGVSFDIVTTSDTNYLELPIDDKGGKLVIKNFRKYDHLTIDSLNIHMNCLGSVVSKVTTYNRFKKDGSLDSTYNVEKVRQTGVGACERDTVASMNVSINGSPYKVEVLVKEDPLETMVTGHGYIPRRYRKDIRNYRRRVSYFHFFEGTRQTIYWAELVLE